jgi:FkbM family methyltransferase
MGSGFWIRVFNRLRLLRYLNLKTYILVSGKKICIPVQSGLGLTNLHLSEPWMTQILARLKPLFNGYFVDIGVNLGQTLIKAYAVYGDVYYVGFEPNSTCVNYLQNLVNLNKYNNCNIFPLGISRQPGILKLNFFYEDVSDPCASIVENFRPEQPIHHSNYIPVFDLDNIGPFLPIQRHAILKIDVEGAELDVIKGIFKWIETNQPILMLEILPVYNADNIQRLNRQREIEDIFHSLNYVIARIKKEPILALEILNNIGVHGNIENSDYVLYPESLSKKINECFLNDK